MKVTLPGLLDNDTRLLQQVIIYVPSYGIALKVKMNVHVLAEPIYQG